MGGIVPHVMLKNIANNEPPQEEVLVDRPEVINSITRVSGPFCVEATIPTPVDYEAAVAPQNDGTDAHGSFVDRMLEVLRKSPVLQVVWQAQPVPLSRRASTRLLSSAAAMKAVNASIRSMGFSSHSRKLSAGDHRPFSPLPPPTRGAVEGRKDASIISDIATMNCKIRVF